MRADWRYIAGLFEGEGSFSLAKRVPRSGRHENPEYIAQLAIRMTDREPIEYISQVWGVSVSEEQPEGRRKTVFIALCPAKMIGTTLDQIYPYLKSDRRRREAQLLQRLRENIEASPGRGIKTSLSDLKYRHWLYEQNQIIKGRGQLP